jgi:20S proteasome subunit beta 2
MTVNTMHDATAKLLNDCTGGFNFECAARNAQLLADKNQPAAPKFTKTGTTIAGVVYKDGVVLGADTRSTSGPVVANKNCKKIHYMAPNIYCCGAGTAADCDQVTALISSQLNLQRRNTGEPSRVVCALTRLKRFLFGYQVGGAWAPRLRTAGRVAFPSQGYVSAALVLGGVDQDGPHLHTIAPHGSTNKLPYVTMGSGSLAAMAIFEDEFKKDMSKEDAMELVHRAILSGIQNDMGSGSNVDLLVITKTGVEDHRNR